MRIITRKAFMDLPEGAICCEGTQWAFGDWFRKDGNCGVNDYFMTTLDWTQMRDCAGSNDLMERADRALATGEAMPLDFDSGGRDGCFADDAVYCVLEDDDIDIFIERLKAGKGKSHG